MSSESRVHHCVCRYRFLRIVGESWENKFDKNNGIRHPNCSTQFQYVLSAATSPIMYSKMLCSLMDSKIELDRNVNKHWMCEIYRYIDTVPSRPTIVPSISLIVSFQFESSAAILTRAP